jgi:methionine biosynthesis protein MetW
MIRADFAAIANWVAPHSEVLDLGCGDGSFLDFLKTQKPVHAYGVEIDDQRVLACVQKGLNVIQQDLEGGLALFENQSFDTVVLSQTLQTIHQTEKILSEIGHWSHRLAVAMGHMPVSKSLPYAWFDTPNVRVLTIADFEGLAHQLGLDIVGRVVLHEGRPVTWAANLFGSLAIYRVRGT